MTVATKQNLISNSASSYQYCVAASLYMHERKYMLFVRDEEEGRGGEVVGEGDGGGEEVEEEGD